MIKLSALLVAGLLALAGCGDSDDSAAPEKPAASEDAAAAPAKKKAAAKGDAAQDTKKGTTITLGDSEFGTMLFDSNEQAIYIFENDPEGETVCYDECAEAWPPVFTDGEPEAGDGVKGALLGTVKRRDGRVQVTYADKPLYFYAHEEPGEVLCHNVDLNGGLWWVVGPDGERRA